MYKLSKDYKKLYELVKAGNKIPCYVDYRFRSQDKNVRACRDICEAKLIQGRFVEIGVRGICYSGNQTENGFIEDCERMNLEWIEP